MAKRPEFTEKRHPFGLGIDSAITEGILGLHRGAVEMIIWRGWGIAFPFLIFAVILANQALIEAIGGKALWESHLNIFAGAGLLAGGVVAFLTRHFLIKPTERILCDPKSGREITLRQHHDIFWIDVKWWSLAAAVCGVGVMIFGISKIS